MDVLVSGSRSIQDKSFVWDVLDDLEWNVDRIIHGGARGVDTIADLWAQFYQIETDVHEIPDWVWEQFGRQAGPQRNTYMLDQADAVVVIWDGESAGTKDTMQKAAGDGMPMRKVVVDVDDDGQVERCIVDEYQQDDQETLHSFTGAGDDGGQGEGDA